MVRLARPTVLVTGGAGFLGINLLRYLDARGYDLVSLDMADFTYPDMKERVFIVRGDIRDMGAVERAMKGVDLVVHAAAALPLYSPEDIYTTDVEGTRNVLTVAERHGVRRAVHISSTAVYGILDHHPLVEDDRLVGSAPTARRRSRPRRSAWSSAGAAWSCRSSGPNRSSARSASASSPCSTTGRSAGTTSR